MLLNTVNQPKQMVHIQRSISNHWVGDAILGGYYHNNLKAYD